MEGDFKPFKYQNNIPRLIANKAPKITTCWPDPGYI